MSAASTRANSPAALKFHQDLYRTHAAHRHAHRAGRGRDPALQIRAGRQVSIDEIIGHLPVVIDGRQVSIPIVGNTIKLISSDGVDQGALVAAVCSALH